MVDLFCGRGGWSKGFMAHGWRCIGLDINPQPDYPGEFIQCDIAQLTELPPADFYCCSSPCEQFSVHGMKHFHPNPKWPWLGIALFNHAKVLLEATGRPYIMENVRVAQWFVGRSITHCGPFYLWGSGVPAIMPSDVYGVSKGTKFGLDPLYFGGSGQMWRTMSKAEIMSIRRASRKKHDMYYRTGSKSKGRLEWKAKVAEIPEVISRAVAAVYTVRPCDSGAAGAIDSPSNRGTA